MKPIVAVEDQAVALAILADEHEAARDRARAADRASGCAVAARRVPASALAPGAEQVHQQLGAPRAHQPADAEHLAGAHLERDVAQHRLRRRVARHA